MSGLIERLAVKTGLRAVDLVRIMSRAPRMYKSYLIPKRTGGYREISQPAREVKFVQRAIVEVLLDGLPVHPCAKAYRSGVSIRDNAAPHAGHGPILKVDLKDFFPSIRAMDWMSYCEKNGLDLSAEEVHLVSQLLFYRRPGTRNLTLAIGAPSSPIVSNILMFEFDAKILENLENRWVVYTRYADDMTFSAPRTGYLNGVLTTVAQTIRQIEYPKLAINQKKTTHITTRYGRTVTGLTLANDGRVTIGRDNKRKIRSALHHAMTGSASKDQIQVLAGMLAYVNAVEPEYLMQLRNQYGDEFIGYIQKRVDIGRQLQRRSYPLAQHGAVSLPDDKDEVPF